MKLTIKSMLALTTVCAALTLACIALIPEPQDNVTPAGWSLRATGDLPEGLIYWFTNETGDNVSGMLIFGDHPTVMISDKNGDFEIPKLDTGRISLPRDGGMYILTPSVSLVRSSLDLNNTIEAWREYATWGNEIADEIIANTW